MGTRSLTRVFDETYGKSQQIINMYRQYDGYPSGHGMELAKFMSKIKMVNGIGMNPENVANGAGCLAAQIVAHFKTEPGGIYLYPISEKDCGQEYEYHIIVCGPDIKMICFETDFSSKNKRKVFTGAPVEYMEWIGNGGEE